MSEPKHKPPLPKTKRGKPIADLRVGKVKTPNSVPGQPPKTHERIIARGPKSTSGPVGTRPIVGKGDWTKSNIRTLDGAVEKVKRDLRKSKHLVRIGKDIEDPGEEE